MLKKLGFLILAVAFLASCSGESADTPVAVDVTVAQFNATPAEYTGKTVSISGTVDHVCKHGGKRLFLMGPDPADRVKIENGDTPPFDVALEGSDLLVTGIVHVLKVDEHYLANWEAEIAADGSSEEADEEQKTADMCEVNSLRQRLADSGEEFLGFYHIEAKSIEEVKAQ